MELFDYLCQIIITGTGCYSLLAVGSPDPKYRKLAGIVGLIGQPFWLATSIINGQLGLLILVFVYGFSWIRVIITSSRQIQAEKMNRISL